MARVYVQSFGAGYTYVDNDAPTSGEAITIFCIPDPGSQLEEVQAWTSYDEAIALDPLDPQQTIYYNPAWRNVYIEAYYTGSTPEPDPPTFVEKFPWLLKQREFWRMKL